MAVCGKPKKETGWKIVRRDGTVVEHCDSDKALSVARKNRGKYFAVRG